MALANGGKQQIPLRPLFNRSGDEAPFPADKHRRVTLPAQLPPPRRLATYNSRVEKHYTPSRKRYGRASPDLGQQFAGKLSKAIALTRLLTPSRRRGRYPKGNSQGSR